jgi:glucan biosynthesis protein C
VTPASRPPRYPYLDVLRALAVLLLVFFHATGYLLLRRETGDVGLGFRWVVHVFHMPLFFVLSGFVLGIAARRSGIEKQIRSRWRRLAVPFLVAMVTVIPAIKLVGIYFSSMKPETSNHPAPAVTFGNVFSLEPQHLWFLEYLFYLSLIVLGVWWLWRRYGVSERVEQGIRMPLLVALMVLPVAAVLLDGGWEAAYQPDTMVPDLWLSAYYLCFLSAGWLLSTQTGYRESLEKAPGTKLLLGGALIWVAYSNYLDNQANLYQDLTLTRLLVVGASVAGAWLVISGLWGLSARLFASPGRFTRVFADSSYWMYIVHLPILVFVESELARTSLPVLARWLLAIAITALSCVLTYSLFVRGRFLGSVLGERAPRAAGGVVREGAVATVPPNGSQHADETEPGSAGTGLRAGDGARAASARAVAQARDEPLPRPPNRDN